MTNPKNRRKHFLIDRPFQFRYMTYIVGFLITVVTFTIISLYFGFWSGVQEALSNEKVQNELLIASRMAQYEDARIPQANANETHTLYKQAEKLSVHQKAVLKSILNITNAKLVHRAIVLILFIAWASIYLSHKIAGPLYRFQLGLESIKRGDLRARIQLRATDEAKSLANDFNEAVERLDIFVSRMKNVVKENESNPERLKTRLKEELSKIKSGSEE